MAGRVHGPRRPLNLRRLRWWTWALFWAVAGAALLAWVIGVSRPW